MIPWLSAYLLIYARAGNQDTTTCVWDVRQPSSPIARMAGNMGAIRSLRFSSGGFADRAFSIDCSNCDATYRRTVNS